MSLDHLALMADDVEKFARALEIGPADSQIAGCPGWTLPALGIHLGVVQRWARAAALTGAPPQPAAVADQPPDDLPGIAAWLREGAARLLVTLHELDPSQPTWHPFPVEPKIAGLWRRRQAQEASVHRWDAQLAIGLAPSIETEFADDGVDEYWTVMLPRMLLRESLAPPASVLGVRATDTGSSWVIDGADGTVRLAAGGAAPTGWVHGSAEALLLSLWGRPVPEGAIHTGGDERVVDSWLALGGA